LPGEQVTGVVFSRVSADGEEGFPGELHIEAAYYITAASELVFTWSAKFCGQNKLNTPSPINLTNHAYWNLSGDFKQATVDQHKLKLFSSNYLPLD
jgi:aldose 1-epimerase